MSDLISRQAAIDAIDVLKRNYPSSCFEDLCKAVDIAIKVLSAQPEQRWIPCSERLPEENGRYLVTRGLKACDSLWNRVYILNYSDLMGLKKEKIWWSGNVGKSDFERHDNVLAWMPLPEPYKESEDKE
jgi:hypothetical protein